MSFQDNLDASFKGVPFFVKSEALPEFGRNLAVSKYPNTSEQFAEDTGGFSEEFDVTGFVVGKDAKQQFEAFRNACNEKGSGSLTLPYFGTRDMLAGKGSLTINPNADVECIEFNIMFHSSRSEAGMSQGTETPMTALSLGETARAGYDESFSSKFLPSTDDFLGDVVAITDLNAMLVSVGSFKNFASNSDWGKILSKIDTIAGNAAQIISSGRIFADQFCGDGGLYGLLSTALIGNGTSSLIAALSSDSNSFEGKLPTDIKSINGSKNASYEYVGQYKNYWDETTKIRIDRNENRRLMADFHRFNILTIAYENFAGITFDTSQDASYAKTTIEESYINLLHGIYGIEVGVNIIDGESVRSKFAVSDLALGGLEKVRISSLQASRGGLVVRFKSETQKIEQYYGISILNLAYLSDAERLTNEIDMVNYTQVLRKANRRATFGIKGTATVLRRAA